MSAWELDMTSVPVARTSRAAVLVYDGTAAAVVDPDAGRFVRLPDVPTDGTQKPLALSYDGTRVLFWCIEDRGRTLLLVLHTLATGDRMRFTTPPGCFDYAAALAPNGQTVATLADATEDGEDVAVIDLVDIATRQRRRLWSESGGAASAGVGIAWSPDGQRIAATYYHAPSDELATTVVDVDTGASLAHQDFHMLRGCPNGSWVDGHGLVLVDLRSDEPGPLVEHLLDVSGGTTTRLARLRRVAHVGERALVRDEGGTVSVADLDGGDGMPLFTVVPNDLDFRTFDIAPELLPGLVMDPR